MESKLSARTAMTINPELVQTFIDSARSAGLSEDQIDSLLDMDLAELQAKSRELQNLKDQGATRPDPQLGPRPDTMDAGGTACSRGGMSGQEDRGVQTGANPAPCSQTR